MSGEDSDRGLSCSIPTQVAILLTFAPFSLAMINALNYPVGIVHTFIKGCHDAH